jgi:LysM repeat protein
LKLGEGFLCSAYETSHVRPVSCWRWPPADARPDAATEERLNKLAGQIEDLIAAQRAQQNQINDLSRAIADLRDRMGRPSELYASQEDLRRLADAVKEIDRKRLEDAERIHKELLNLGKTLTAASARAAAPASSSSGGGSKPSLPDKYFEHTVARGDTLSTIVEAYREQNIKVTVDSILKANPGLKPERLQVGQKIIIPAP